MFRAALNDQAWLALLELRHAEELFRVCDRNRDRLSRYLPWVEHTRSTDDVSAFIRTALGQYANNQGYHAGIWRQDELAGCIGMHPIDWGNRSVSLGYWIDQAHEGQGLITQACRHLLGECFRHYGLHRVEIRCAADNQRSAAIPRKLGFREEGLLRGAQRVGGRWLDLLVFGKLAIDHQEG